MGASVTAHDEVVILSGCGRVSKRSQNSLSVLSASGWLHDAAACAAARRDRGALSTLTAPQPRRSQIAAAPRPTAC
eukprot:4148121-Prymnesium_polylepis.1